MQVFFRTPKEKLVCTNLADKFTLKDFLNTADDVMGLKNRDETLSFRYVVGCKSLNVKDEHEFQKNKDNITENCNIFILGRLLGGSTLMESLETIVEQQLEDELDRVARFTSECSICLETDATNCLKVCCVWMCREDFKRWLLEKQFKASCILCSKKLVLKDIFKTPEFNTTLQAYEEEKLLLKNMDCQRCLDCDALMYNETMKSRQKCIICNREFCFFCNRKWNPTTMTDLTNTCGNECVYQTMLSFELTPFHYNSNIKVPSRRTCPRKKRCAKLNTSPDTTMSASEAQSSSTTYLDNSSHEEILKLQYVICTKSPNLRNETEFNQMKHDITKYRDVMILYGLPDGFPPIPTLRIKAEKQLEDKLDRMATNTSRCSICPDSNATDCLRLKIPPRSLYFLCQTFKLSLMPALIRVHIEASLEHPK
ncbi:hypothetical protein BGZ49_005848 [Haplosporangium sp. Z 27]|nr:hypothetical protein BGZ49_005848 [Haplosporangium sp. Z 27]